MKILRCREIGERVCNYLAVGRSQEEVERQLLDHAEERHPMFIESMDWQDREKLLEQMEAMVESREERWAR